MAITTFLSIQGQLAFSMQHAMLGIHQAQLLVGTMNLKLLLLQ